MLRALLLSLVLVLTASCTAATDLASDPGSSETSASPSEKASQTATPSPSPTADPPPKAGTCRLLRPADLNTVVNDSEPVPCSRRHTSVTYHVEELPAKVARTASSPDDDRVEDVAERVCSQQVNDYVGGKPGDRKLSSLRTTYFLPDAEQFEMGANWVRCDLFAYAADGRLAELPGRLEGALGDESSRANLGICSKVGPDHERFEHIICQRDHNWRAVARVRLGPDNAGFPGPRQLSDRARSECEGRVRDYLGTDDAFSYGFEVPRREAWQQGTRHGLCWAQTSD